MHGKCPNPNCAQPLEQTRMGNITIGDRISGPFYNGISAICPHCETIVGVCIDPDDIASDVMRGLNKAKSPQNLC